MIPTLSWILFGFSKCEWNARSILLLLYVYHYHVGMLLLFTCVCLLLWGTQLWKPKWRYGLRPPKVHPNRNRQGELADFGWFKVVSLFCLNLLVEWVSYNVFYEWLLLRLYYSYNGLFLSTNLHLMRSQLIMLWNLWNNFIC